MNTPKILTQEEIAALTAGDARRTDQIILASINGLSEAFLEFRYRDFPEHAKAEEKLNTEIMGVLSEVGDKATARKRMAYIDSLIERNRERTEMYRQVTRAGTIFILIAFIGFLGRSLWMSVSEAVQATIHHGANKP